MNVIDVERFGSGARIPIGRQGENLAREIRISTKGFEDAHEGGTAVLLFRRSANEDPYPVPIQAEEGAVTWQPTATDTARAGFGQMEVQWYVGDVLQKSKIYQTYIEKSLEPAGEEPEHPGESWVQQVIEAAQSGADPDTIKGLVEEYLEENPPEAYDDAEVKQDIVRLDNTKLTAPPTASVGQFFKVANIDENGHYVLEAVDAPSGGVQDVRVTGSSIVQDGVADIPVVGNKGNGLTLVRLAGDGLLSGVAMYGDNISSSIYEPNLMIVPAPKEYISSRLAYCHAPITPGNLDLAVKSALCDGKGAEWNEDEQQAAQRRLGILSVEEVLF